jgi:hypothetical protein
MESKEESVGSRIFKRNLFLHRSGKSRSLHFLPHAQQQAAILGNIRTEVSFLQVRSSLSLAALASLRPKTLNRVAC